MTRRWMTVLMVLLALAMIGSTGCLKKKKKAIDANAPFGDQVIVGYNPDGTPIYGSAADAAALAGRTEGAEIAASQFEAVRFDYDTYKILHHYILNPAHRRTIRRMALPSAAESP